MLPGYDVCGECGGTGEIQVTTELLIAYIDGGHFPDRCPSCSGVGSVPGDATVEALAEAVGPFVFSPHKVVDTARAALVAYAQHAKENP